ncbi:DUF427 domain-containing protein [Candidatus Nephthysia bennettiae]
MAVASARYRPLMSVVETIVRPLRAEKSQWSRVKPADWNRAVLAGRTEIVAIEGNHYFSPDSLPHEHFKPNSADTFRGWKGQASHLDVVVEGKINRGAPRHYLEPSPAAARIASRVAAWHGMCVQNRA